MAFNFLILISKYFVGPPKRYSLKSAEREREKKVEMERLIGTDYKERESSSSKRSPNGRKWKDRQTDWHKRTDGYYSVLCSMEIPT